MNDVFEQESLVERWDTDYYQPVSEWLYDRAICDMLRIMGPEESATVLDAGCGVGLHTIRVARAGYSVVAADISEAALRDARQRVKEAGLEQKVIFRQADLTDLDFDDASFDYVFSWGVVIHIADAQKALDELARIVAPGGKLALYITNRRGIDHAAKSAVRFILRKPFVDLHRSNLGEQTWYEKEGGRLCVWQFNPDAVTQHMATQGFRLISRRIGEFSEIQRHTGGLLRKVVLRINNVAYRCNLTARIATGNMLIFEKSEA